MELTGQWLVNGKDGRLTAYVADADGLYRWTEDRPASGQWSGPAFFPVSGLTHLTAVQGVDTYVHFLGRRERAHAGGRIDTDIVHAIQYQSGRPVTEWRSLGNPHSEQDRARQLGAPAAVTDERGTVFVFARNAGGGLMLRREGKTGKWERWTDLRGSDLLDPPVPVATSDGRVEVVASTRNGVLRWAQSEPDGPFETGSPTGMHALPGSGVALETAPGRPTYYWTDAGRSGVVAHRPGGWPIPLGGAPGDGAIAAVRTMLDGYDCTVLAQRGPGGTVVVGVCGTEAEQNGVWWSDTGVECAGAPALVRDAYGRVVLGVTGRDGSPRVVRQEQGPGLTLSPRWEQL
ncbi:hypothetical protein [Streptomyces indicus]|uniref:PQQ-like domain-containing protein n=1 Tax=Streptomyces indicus TaxID=417292 RepID=A0A1G9AP67_9ACTN|nr:hypothetical protein [Streptomyces indicus]SDK29033.1 hypothetical protein SAMN05421806_10675 [Streptomyces indicus]